MWLVTIHGLPSLSKHSHCCSNQTVVYSVPSCCVGCVYVVGIRQALVLRRYEQNNLLNVSQKIIDCATRHRGKGFVDLDGVEVDADGRY